MPCFLETGSPPLHKDLVHRLSTLTGHGKALLMMAAHGSASHLTVEDTIQSSALKPCISSRLKLCVELILFTLP